MDKFSCMFIFMVATGQEMVRENKNSSRSGKSQGILFWVRENWHFEEKSGKIEINCKTDLTLSKAGRSILGQMGAKDCCNWRLEAATISEILHLFGQGNLPFIREKSGKSHGILKTDVCGNHDFVMLNNFDLRLEFLTEGIPAVILCHQVKCIFH